MLAENLCFLFVKGCGHKLTFADVYVFGSWVSTHLKNSLFVHSEVNVSCKFLCVFFGCQRLFTWVYFC